MRYSHICALTFLIALVRISTVTLVLAQLEKEPSLNVLALGPTSDRDEQSITKSGRLESRDLDQNCDETIIALRGPSNHGANSCHYVHGSSRPEAGCDFPISERSLLTDIATTAFRLVWDYLDIIYPSYIAFRQTSELWANVTANARGKWKAERDLMTLDICYGSLKVSIAGLIDAISWEMVADFAAEVLLLSRIVVFGSFRVFLFVSRATIVITLAIVAQVRDIIHPQQLVTGP